MRIKEALMGDPFMTPLLYDPFTGCASMLWGPFAIYKAEAEALKCVWNALKK